MKKVVQLALLIAIISTATTHCWEWFDVVPTRLQNWYQNWQIRKQELQRFKELKRGAGADWRWIKGSNFIRRETPIESWEREKGEQEQRAISTADDKMRLYYERSAQAAAKNIAILKKHKEYKDLPQVKLHYKYFYSDYF